MLIQASLVLALSILFSFSGFAQDTRSTLFGYILDTQGSVITGATVVVTNVDTNTKVTTRSNETGYYQANLLVAGSYEVGTEAPGFKKLVRKGVSLPVSTQLQVDLKLELGSVSETVSVVAEAPLLDTSAASSGRLLDNKSVMNLPEFSGRTFDLTRFAPGMQGSGIVRLVNMTQYSTDSLGRMPGGVGGNEWTIDGMPNLGSGRNVGEMPFTDLVQEFKVDTSGFDASIGHTAGALVSVMTKAGTNTLHGGATWQHWQQRWNGSGFFVKQLYYRQIAAAEASGDRATADALRGKDKQASGHSNNYAATIGGPVRIPKLVDGRNRLFFFFSMNGFQDRKPAFLERANKTIPTMANREGDFSNFLQVDPVRFALYDPLSVRRDPARPNNFIRDPIPNNVLAKSRIINPSYNAYKAILPVPNNDPTDPRLEPRYNYLAFGMPFNWQTLAFSNRIDYQATDKLRFFGRWTWARPRENSDDWTYESAPGLHNNRLTRRNRGFTVDAVYLFGAATVLNVTAGANEFRQSTPIQEAYSYPPSKLGFPSYVDQKANPDAILPNITFAGGGLISYGDGYQTIGLAIGNPQFYRTLTTKGDVSHVRGKHAIRVGGELRGHFRTGGGGGYTSGSYNFTNEFTRRNDDTLTPAGNLAHSWAAFMMGLPSAMTIDNNDTFAFHSPYYAFFVQDNLRLTSKLSLNFGLRTEYELGITERYDRMIGGFDPSLTLPITQASQAAYAANPVPELSAANFHVLGGSLYPGAGGVDRHLNKSELLWLPRLGFAYQMSSKTVVRGGYGIFYDTINPLVYTPDQFGFNRATLNRITNDYGVNWLTGDPRNGVAPMSDPFPVRANGQRFDLPIRDALGNMASAGRGYAFYDYDFKHTRQQRWRASVQRQIGATMIAEAAYVGTYGTRLPLGQVLSSLPEQYWADGQVRNNTVATNLNSNVRNPFYIGNFEGLRTSSPLLYQELSQLPFFQSTLIRKSELLRAFPQIGGLQTRTSPLGASRTHSMELTLQRRFSKGFNLNASYTRLSADQADIFFNEYDAEPSYRASNNGRPHRFTLTGVWELPFGKGRRWLSDGMAKWIVGGWQIASAYEFQQGPLLDFGNLFYYGNDLGAIATGEKTFNRWFNTDGFERVASRAPAAFHKRVFPTRVDDVRADGLNFWSANVAREIQFVERVRMQLRLDAINLLNRSHFGAPDTNPVSTNFGVVTAQTPTSNRVLQIQARIIF